jgi:hypothetical protein
MSSNAIEVIQNDTLQEYLISWKNVLLDYLEEENNYYTFLNSFVYPSIIKNYDLLSSDKSKILEV